VASTVGASSLKYSVRREKWGLSWGVKFVPKLVDFIHPIFIPFDVAK